MKQRLTEMMARVIAKQNRVHPFSGSFNLAKNRLYGLQLIRVYKVCDSKDVFWREILKDAEALAETYKAA